MNRETETLMVEVAYLCGFSNEEAARAIHGVKDGKPVRRGPVLRIIRDKGLVAARASAERPSRLIAIERNRPDLVKFIDKCSRIGQVRATSILLDWSVNPKDMAEMVARRRLREDMSRVRDILPEAQIIPEIRGRGIDQIIYNAASCNLSILGSRGLIPEWAVQAGVRLRSDFHAAGASMGSIDYAKPIVDGGRAPGRTDSSLDASGRISRAIDAVQTVFPGKDQKARIAIISHAVFESRTLATFPFIVDSPTKFLLSTLEPVGYVYGTLLDGPVAKRLNGIEKSRASA